ncbi:MAG: hypothetical protein MUO39_00920 [Steroidobacteraceae bacterium]|nr:hypothetical protein [Steroidobacteraceae bacterium]
MKWFEIIISWTFVPTIEIEVRLQKAFTSLASIGHAAMRDAAIHHARLALARAENVLELPEDIEVVRKLAKFANSVNRMSSRE